LPSSTTLAEHLLRQARLSLAVEDVPIARHVIGSLDDRGYFSGDVADLASELGVERGRVEEVLAVIQTLEPVGIAARDARECLLIQIADLGGESQLRPDRVERSVAERLIRDHWDSLGRSSLASLGQEVDASADEVRGALRFIRENLNPFPTHTCWADARRATSNDEAECPQPDVIIRERETPKGGYEIELPKAGSYSLRVRRSYRWAMEDGARRQASNGHNGSSVPGQPSSSPRDREGWKRWQELCGRARLFVKSIEQRWETLYELMCCLVDYQRDFLIHGERRLKPLTRAQVAEIMGMHESTVSRAVAGKYVELPCGEVVSLDTFFDSAAPLKHMIEELINHEKVPLSDRAIADRLTERGYDVSRRTVAKYRNAMNILPSTLRERSKELRALR
jgi:RNA polymerase sigma-54 factor